MLPSFPTSYIETIFGCDKLERVKLPSTVEFIRKCAFYGCYKLKEISLPVGLKEISDYLTNFIYIDSMFYVIKIKRI